MEQSILVILLLVGIPVLILLEDLIAGRNKVE
ncbi:MAG: hypothetical protein RLY86_552 [Pseudomonadota bacterium]|jgi:hypothetical protein